MSGSGGGAAASREAASVAVIVDAKDDKAVSSTPRAAEGKRARYGFITDSRTNGTDFLPMAVVEQLAD